MVVIERDSWSEVRSRSFTLVPITTEGRVFNLDLRISWKNFLSLSKKDQELNSSCPNLPVLASTSVYLPLSIDSLYGWMRLFGSERWLKALGLPSTRKSMASALCSSDTDTYA